MSRRSISALAACVLALAGCGGSTATVTDTVTVTAQAEAAAPELAQFGYVRSLERKGDGWELRFDPALFLSGETANVAAAEDGKVEPGEPVPNDNYVVDEGPRELTYLVPADAKVTVLADGPQGKPIPVEELAQIVQGTHEPLFEPIGTGFWIRYRIDTVSSLEQQYRP